MKSYDTIEHNGLRWYYHISNKNVLYPSCTTVLGWKDKLFGKWKGRKAGNAANCGTGIHFQIEKYILDTYHIGEYEGFPLIDIYMSEEERRYKLNKSMQMWFKFLKDNPTYKPIAQELALFQEGRQKYAGRIDQYIELNNQKILMDLKTGGFWPEYPLQLAGYYQLLSEITDIDLVMILFLDANKERNPEQIYHTITYDMSEIEKNVIKFNKLLDEYYHNDVYNMAMIE